MKKQKLIKVYCPVNYNTNVKGYWKDENGQIFIDNIIIQYVTELNFFKLKRQLFFSGELAIFYIQNNIAYITSKNHLEILRHKTILENINQQKIPELLKEYSGFTYFENLNIIEIWKD